MARSATAKILRTGLMVRGSGSMSLPLVVLSVIIEHPSAPRDHEERRSMMDDDHDGRERCKKDPTIHGRALCTGVWSLVMGHQGYQLPRSSICWSATRPNEAVASFQTLRE